jgi:hypothetical protein
MSWIKPPRLALEAAGTKHVRLSRIAIDEVVPPPLARWGAGQILDSGPNELSCSPANRVTYVFFAGMQASSLRQQFPVIFRRLIDTTAS